MLSVKYLSYIDDISVIVASTSFYRNIGILERKIDRLVFVDKQNAISFDIAKTELIHFTGLKEAKKHSLILSDNTVIQPKSLVKWLGIYFDPNLIFKEYIAI